MTIGGVQLDVQIPAEAIQYLGWFLVFGICLVVLGIAAVVRAAQATVVSMMFFGWLLVLAAAIEIAQAVVVGQWGAVFFEHLLAAILFAITGALIIMRPTMSAEVATVLMAVFFLVGGLFQLVGSVAAKWPGWGWQAADGIITFVLGLLVLAEWPASGLWMIGLFVGIDLILFGLAWIAFALSLRSA